MGRCSAYATEAVSNTSQFKNANQFSTLTTCPKPHLQTRGLLFAPVGSIRGRASKRIGNELPESQDMSWPLLFSAPRHGDVVIHLTKAVPCTTGNRGTLRTVFIA
jgi:hypothetical protein